MIVDEITQKGYTAYILSNNSRNKLLKTFPGSFSRLIAHHVTYEYNVDNNRTIPEVKTARVVGYAINSKGLEALVVEINGSTVRPDSGAFHITWSLTPGTFKPADSNALLKESKWNTIQPVSIELTPEFVPFRQ